MAYAPKPSLKQGNPEAALMWAYDLNDSDLTPETVSLGSKRKAFFRCLKDPNHVFEKKICKMTSYRDGHNVGCIFCGPNAKSAIAGENDFITMCPPAKDMWDYEKNTELNPYKLLSKSNKYAHFKCSYGHETYRKIEDFFHSPKCTVCEQQKNGLFYNHPETKLFWRYEKNTDIDVSTIIQSSREMAYFKCPECKYEWKSRINLWHTRPFCQCCGYDGTTGSQERNKVNLPKTKIITFRMQNPIASELWDYDNNKGETPDSLLAHSNFMAHFKCEKGHTFTRTLDTMYTYNKEMLGCIICRDIDKSTRINEKKNLKQEDKEIATLSKLMIKSYIEALSNRNKEGKAKSSNTNNTTNIRDSKEYKSIAKSKPNMLEFWDYEKNNISPYDISPYSKKRVWWKCKKCGYSWETQAVNRINATKCPSCDMNRVYSHDNNSANTFIKHNPEAAKCWVDEMNNGILPNTISKKSGKKVYLRCPNNANHIYEIYIFTIPKKSPFGCPYCRTNARIAQTGKNDIFTMVSNAAEMWDYEKNTGIDPHDIIAGSTKKYWWKCNEGHSFIKSAVNFKRSPKCPVCSDKKQKIISYPHMMKQWNFEKNTGIDVNTTSAFSKKSAYWKCKSCGYEWTAQISTRKVSKGLCPCCENRTVVVKGVTDIFSMVPELKLEYNFIKNNEIDADTLSVTSLSVVWWKCKECSHEWKASVSSRVKALKDGTYGIKNCPACAGVRRRISYAEEYPDLVNRFDTELNDFSLYDASIPLSDKQINWICDICGNRFKANISSMVRSYNNKSHGCRACSFKITPKEKSFAYLYPNFMEEYAPYNEIDPFAYAPTSSKKVFWICKNNPEHTWKTSFKTRTKNHGNCPICNQTDRRLLKDARPDLRKNYLQDENEIPFDEISYKSNRTVNWICDMGHRFALMVYSETKSDDFYCPICSNFVLEKGFNDFATRYSDFVKFFDIEKNGFKPDEIRFNSRDTTTWWTCTHHHSYQQSVSDRVKASSCPLCIGRIIQPGVNDFLTAYPDVIKIWGPGNDKQPEEYFDRTNMEMDFLCEKGHHYKASAYYVREYGTDCLVCRNIILLKGTNSFADKHPELIPEWSPNNKRSASDYLYSSPYDVLWICLTCKGEYSGRINKRQFGDDSCPYCNNRKVLAGFNSLDAVKPELVPEWSPNNKLSASDYMDTATHRVLWMCPTCKGEYTESIRNREYGDDSCPYCKNKKVLAGFNSFKVLHSDLMEEWDTQNNYIIIDPDNILDKCTDEVWWVCKKHPKPLKYLMSPKRRVYLQERNMIACPRCKGYNRKKRHYL